MVIDRYISLVLIHKIEKWWGKERIDCLCGSISLVL